jgi:hypothetical protein
MYQSPSGVFRPFSRDTRIFFAFLVLPILLPTFPAAAQYLPVHLSNQGIYLFLDELASEGCIDLCSLVKPYSRREISLLLQETGVSRAAMTRARQAELDFFLRDYMKDLPPEGPVEPATSWLWQKRHGNKRFDLFYYSDSLFRLTVNPIVGGDVWANGNGAFYHWWNGVEAWSSVGRFAFWASLRDNHESVELTARDFQNQRIGGANIKVFSDGKRDYEEFRGGITYGWNSGFVGLIMDQFSWGEHNAGANILSGRTPAFPRLELALDPVKWFSFRYVHGFLYSEVVDSTRSFWVNNSYGPEYREVYHSKYLAANMFTFIPVKGLELSVGNSVIYDLQSPSAGFLIPIAFFKAIDHSMNASNNNNNSQLFFSLSSRNLKHFHFYGNIFIDELAVDRIFDPDEYNFVSYKAGLSSTLLLNMRMVAEYTWTNALTFMHYVPTTTFESNQYNLGHYLEDNAKEIFLSASYQLIRTLRVEATYCKALKGPDHTALGTERTGIAPFDPVVWESESAGLLASFQLVNDLCIRVGYEWRRVTGEEAYLDRWTPEVYRGKTQTFRFGLNYGF